MVRLKACSERKHCSPEEMFATKDASVAVLGAELSQFQADGTIKAVAFESRTLSTSERKYRIGEVIGTTVFLY